MRNEEVKSKLEYLGLKINHKVFIYMRLVISFLLFMILLLFCTYGYILAPVITCFYYFSIEYFILDRSIKKRVLELEKDAFYFFSIFLSSLRGCTSIKKSLYISTEIVNNSLSLEFKKVLRDMEIGRSFDDALSNLKRRIPSKTINNIIDSMIDAFKTGGDVSDSINLQLKYLDNKYKEKLLAKYRIVPLKIAILSIVFVLIILIVLMFFNFVF